MKHPLQMQDVTTRNYKEKEDKDKACIYKATTLFLKRRNEILTVHKNYSYKSFEHLWEYNCILKTFQLFNIFFRIV
jgi:hypothetical protein